MTTNQRVASWEVTDDFWARVAPLIPVPQRMADKRYLRKPDAGRSAKPARQVFEANMFVLRPGCLVRGARVTGRGAVVPILADHGLPEQKVHAVFPSPKLVPLKVTSFSTFLQQSLAGGVRRQTTTATKNDS